MSLRSFFHRSQSGRRIRRANYGHTTRRPRFETLEDLCLLSFTPAVNYATAPATPSAIVTADFNNDGKLDLATCAFADTGSFSVLLGDGAGGFGAAQRVIIGSYLFSMAVADFNGDSNLDIVLADTGNAALQLMKGYGDGTFQSAVTMVQWNDVGAVAVADFNNDNNADLLVNLWNFENGNYFQVQLGNSHGGFAGSVDDPFVYDPRYDSAMAIVDVNNDGKLDMVTPGVDVFLGNGNSALQSKSYSPVNGSAVATGDFTGDGNADVVVAGNSMVAVLRGQGDGDFDAPIPHPANGTVHTAVATADFNADGKLDAVVTDRDTGTVSLMLGNGDGTLRYAGALPTGTSPEATVVGDFDRDGRPDMAVANAGSKNVSVLLNDGVWLVGPELPGDYNQSGDVDAADYVVWRKTQGQTVAPYAGADGNGDSFVDHADRAVWAAHFGQTVPTVGAGSLAAAVTATAVERSVPAESAAPAKPSDLSATGIEVVNRDQQLSNRPPGARQRDLALAELDRGLPQIVTRGRGNSRWLHAPKDTESGTLAHWDDLLLTRLAVGDVDRHAFEDGQNSHAAVGSTKEAVEDNCVALDSVFTALERTPWPSCDH